ncbi:hypothetical protein V8V80_24590 [Niallia taxi]
MSLKKQSPHQNQQNHLILKRLKKQNHLQRRTLENLMQLQLK